MENNIKIDKEKIKIIDELLERSVAEILPTKEAFKELLLSGKKIRFYIGTDATGSSLHLGHATNYIVFEKLRKLGHEAILLIGDFTARIGDPSDKTSARQQLSREDVKENIKTWMKQLEPLIDFNDKINPPLVKYNHDWLAKLNFEDLIGIASNFTVQRMLERDMFEKRLKEEKPIYVHEFFYPLMQGYDSVAMDVDMELCGNDQKFNALAGRTLQKKYNNKEKFVFITTLLVNPVTGEKMMSKSLGTGIFLDSSVNDMFGKVMTQADENIAQLFVDCTFVPMDEIKDIKKKLKNNEVNPRDLKMDLAYEIVKIYHGEQKAKEAKNYFVSTFSKKEVPTEMTELKPSAYDLVSILVEAKFVSSKTDARRVIEQGGVKVDSQVIKDTNFTVLAGSVVQKGKINFLKVK
ncbi:tyrosine--tRNA ligase [Candidatus Falkowbacteria bacterium HGW-Falkowbacteria-1]|uniref:Tyrosine--tRNA ligase n=1 Tax=Candidatus Falkowbacteria bacterium HGW-Falkowbacteria-1 TaxID=2013768 RepID=A0A2N2EAY8_9BACT|nr:MAG: tyrosine--tRNA ligase [Candidatus Falkowbacteria bacterium HGW-Falkowbacteria-1]